MKQVKIGQILQSDNSQEDQEKMISYLNDQKVTDKIVAEVGIMADSDKLSSEDLIEHTVQAEEQK